MTGAIVNHLWQSTVFLVAAAAAAVALRRNQASVRHGIWLAASLKFIVPFSLLIAFGGSFAWRSGPAPDNAGVPAIADTVQAITLPFEEMTLAPATASDVAAPHSIRWPMAFAALWICGGVVVVAIRVRAWRAVRAAIRASAPVTLPGVDNGLSVRATPGLLEPGVVGFWRPVLLMPVGVEAALTSEQLRAVVEHELHHIRRRDNLTSAMHMAVETLFWFHPLVWWIGARLIDERERACDEHVLAIGAAPEAYAEGILNVCKRYVESPVACVAGVTGADLKKRVSAILACEIGSRLTVTRRLLLAAAAIVLLGMPVLAGAIISTSAAATVGKPTSNQAVAGASANQKFDVASIRPCDGASTPTGGRNGGVGPVFSPGLFVYNCGTLEQLINGAYVANGEALLNDEGRAGGNKLRDEKTFPQRIRGGPDWMRTDRFMIEAKTDVSTGATGRQALPERAVMMGPMLRALLEDRFKLKLHREEQRDVPMYALTVAKGGFKIKPAGPDSCAPADPNRKEPYRMDEEIETVRKGGKPICGHGIMGGPVGPNNALVLNGQTMAGVARFLSGIMDRHVLDDTGLTDTFVMYLEYAPDDLVPYDFLILPRTTDPPTAPSITQVLKSLGLELQPAKGPKGYIVIDHVEHPAPGGRSAGPARAQGAGGAGR